MGKWGKRDWKNKGKLSKIVLFCPIFLLFPINFTLFFIHFPKCIFGNFSQFPTFPHFPPFPPNFPLFSSFFPSFPIFPFSPFFQAPAAARLIRLQLTRKPGTATLCLAIPCRQVVVNIHSSPRGVLETFRLYPLLSNGKAVVSESSEESGYKAEMDDAVVFCGIEDMPELCRRLCADERTRRRQEAKAYDFAKAHRFELSKKCIAAIQA